MLTSGSVLSDFMVEVEDLGAVTVLRLNGRFVRGEERDAVHYHLKRLQSKRKTRIVVNMAGVTHTDDSIAVVISALTAARNQGGDVKLAAPSKHVECFLSISKLHSLFQVFPSEEEALASFQ